MKILTLQNSNEHLIPQHQTTYVTKQEEAPRRVDCRPFK